MTSVAGASPRLTTTASPGSARLPAAVAAEPADRQCGGNNDPGPAGAVAGIGRRRDTLRPLAGRTLDRCDDRFGR